MVATRLMISCCGCFLPDSVSSFMELIGFSSQRRDASSSESRLNSLFIAIDFVAEGTDADLPRGWF